MSEEQLGRGHLAGLIVAVLATILVALLVVTAILKGRRHEDLVQYGAPAAATVLDVRATGSFHNSEPEVQVRLRITPEAGAPFDGEVTTNISPVYLPRFQLGAVVNVRYDPKDRSRVALVLP